MKRTRLVFLIIFVLMLAGCSVSFTTANITDPGMTSAVESGAPVDSITTYTQDAKQLYAYGILNNAPDDTTVTFVWTYDTQDYELYTVDMNNEGESGIYVISTLETDEVWPIGDYSIEIYIDDREEPDATIRFTVK